MTAMQGLTGAELRTIDGAHFGVEAGAILPGPVAERPGVRLVVRSGWPAVEPGDEAAAWRVRAGGGMRALEEALGGLLERGLRVCVRPAAAEVLSDVPSTLSLLRKHESATGPGGGLEVLCAPGDLISGAMLRHAADHYLRALAALAGHPAVAGVLLEDVTAAGEAAAACAPGAGLLPGAVWEAAFGVVRASGKPLVASELATSERLAAVGWSA